jgi:hypothetical protein
MQPTVADANLPLGRMDEATVLGGGIHLDGECAMRMLRAQTGSSATVEGVCGGDSSRD